ncbi:MAG: flippase-like domain-containing protein [Actinobacteria bacterium]|nr:flippase-like domain-containing protein [Actinomycetota bacterium]
MLAIRGRWSDVESAGGLPGVVPVAVAVALNIVGNLILAYTWREIVAVVGPRIAFRSAMWVWSVSQLARFTLSTAQAGARAVMARRYGITTAVAGSTAVVELAWFSAVDAVLVFVTLPLWLQVAEGWGWVAAVGALPAVVLVMGMVRPTLLLRMAAWALRLPGVRRIRGGTLAERVDEVEVASGTSVRITVYFLANFGLRLAAFLVMVAGTVGSLTGVFGLAVGAFVFGQFVGRIAVFSPGGIGPREGATALVLAPTIGAGPALVVVTAIRLAEIVAELVSLALARAVKPAA